jgi:oxygen-independent coproporphyrinogen-3 oxidase
LAGIYLHIPLCKQACYYCDFHFSTYFGLKDEIVNTLKKELILRKSYLGTNRIDTIYLGGGTPTVLSNQDLESLIDIIFKTFNIGKDPEITIEANPDDLISSKTKKLKILGFNRLSIGIQSFDDRILKYLNRNHNSEDSFQAIKNAEKAGFENINLDLIFAIRKNYINVLKDDIEKFLVVNPQHISTYSLTVEEKTVFGNWARKGKINTISSDITAIEFEYIMETLEKAGYQQYEISNFSKPGFISIHNSNYWKGIPYLGIGPSAHSFNGTSRQSNISNNSNYIKSIEKGIIPCAEEVLSKADKINDLLLTGLRTIWGVDLNLIKKRFGVDLERYNKSYIQDLIRLDLATFNNGKIQLSKKGILIADKICGDLFFIDEND